ncbi:exosome complex protein Rrp42 [Candidatus Woesearchaeota archaeon]|nr:exosome complex protein Rrp42 [Candidatus Woesearchaeota archaeon]
MNQEMKEHIKQALKQGKRLDGRALDEVRPIKIETGIISTAEGSAKVKFGNAEVLAGVKMAIEKPYPDTPEDGVLMVNAELLPLSSPEFESGPPSIESIETARVIDRGIRESKTLDTKSLCIEKGEKVWSVALDIVPINFDGNLIDMGGLAAVAAIKTARFPNVDKEGNVDYHKRSDKKLEMVNTPIPITICKVGDLFIVDPTEEEERAVDTRLTITTLDENTVCALQKGGDAPLKTEDIKTMVDLAFQTANKIRKSLEEVN